MTVASTKAQRASNRALGLAELRKLGAQVTVVRKGHVTVRKGNAVIDYYTGTGNFRRRKIGLMGNNGAPDGHGFEQLKELLSQIEIPKL